MFIESHTAYEKYESSNKYVLRRRLNVSIQLQNFSQFREVGSSRLAQWRKTLECQTQFWLQVWSAIRWRLSAAWIDATRLPRVSKIPLYTVALSFVTTCMSADRFGIGCVPQSVASAVCRASMEWCGLSSDPDTKDVQPIQHQLDSVKMAIWQSRQETVAIVNPGYDETVD